MAFVNVGAAAAACCDNPGLRVDRIARTADVPGRLQPHIGGKDIRHPWKIRLGGESFAVDTNSVVLCVKDVTRFGYDTYTAGT